MPDKRIKIQQNEFNRVNPENNTTAVTRTKPPLILAPAGSRDSFLAALAAGADAVYCGLKHFSARMAAVNFTIAELAQLTRLAHKQDKKVYVAFNALLTPQDLKESARLIDQLTRVVRPDALIFQDLAIIELARQTGFKGELHLSTLANVSFSAAMQLIHKDLGIDRVVLPREFTIDEIKSMASVCPPGLSLEVFVHGALCYAISGRCYWSSYLGGKSGLKGRCVQPCRRIYTQKKQTGRFFACTDFSLDVLCRLLLKIPQVNTWKIEGRKKGPHYVYYTVQAYRMLRDHSDDRQSKKAALGLLDMALGRSGTHYHFLPQHRHSPIPISGQTGSGLLLGHIRKSASKLYFRPVVELLADDLLRFGYEDEHGHGRMRVKRYVPRKGRFDIKPQSGTGPSLGAPVFLTDRREKALNQKIALIQESLNQLPAFHTSVSSFQFEYPANLHTKRITSFEMNVYRRLEAQRAEKNNGVWVSANLKKQITGRTAVSTWWWLPPVIWPCDENAIRSTTDFIIARGGRNFILNAPWQKAFFKSAFKSARGLNLWAGPFTNIANAASLQTLAHLGFQGAIISPELGQDHYLALPEQSPLPLGIVLTGNWPLCISRIIAPGFKIEQPFTSPKGERAWIKMYQDMFWMYPAWEMNLREHKEALNKAGYTVFVNLKEPLPKGVSLKKRPGLWNWKINLR